MALLTLTDAKQHLNVTTDVTIDDSLIQSKLAAASDWVAALYRRADHRGDTGPRERSYPDAYGPLI